jgi:hypothetical protein
MWARWGIPTMRRIANQMERAASHEKYLGISQRSTSTQNVYTAIACLFRISK